MNKKYFVYAVLTTNFTVAIEFTTWLTKKFKFFKRRISGIV